MKTIGLIGGMSWESSLEYYRIINQTIKAQLGGLHSARCIMYSVDFAEIETLQHRGDWPEAARILSAAAQSLEKAGADCIVLCTNTMHKVADQIQSSVTIPFLHIADATAARITETGIRRVGLLGTRFTMEESFYKDRLTSAYNLEVILPNTAGRAIIHRVIYEELVLGQINQASREQYKTIIEEMVSRGAQAIILGCTEIGLLIKDPDSPVPLFDTTVIHAQTAVHFALA